MVPLLGQVGRESKTRGHRRVEVKVGVEGKENNRSPVVIRIGEGRVQTKKGRRGSMERTDVVPSRSSIVDSGELDRQV